MSIQTLNTETLESGLTLTETLSTYPDGSKVVSWDVYCEQCDDFIILHSRKEALEVAAEHECEGNEVLNGDIRES